MMVEIKTAYRAAFNFCERFQHAQTSRDFNQAAEQWLRLNGLVADIALATLRAMERRAFGNDVYVKSEVDRVLMLRQRRSAPEVDRRKVAKGVVE